MTKLEPKDKIQLSHLLHMCWSNAVDSPDYNKKVWQDFCQKLRDVGMDIQ